MFPKLKCSNCLILILGSIIQAFGIYNIHALSNVTEGGVLGLTLLLRHWFHISPAVSSLVLNLACYALGWKTLGKSFIAYSLLSICTYSVSYGFLEQFPPLWPQIAFHPFIAAVAGALFIGIGAGLCVRAGGAEKTVEIADPLFSCAVFCGNRFAGIAEGSGFSCLFQHSAAPVGKAQHSGVGSRGGQILCCQTEECTQDHPVDPGPGVALGFGGSDDGFQSSF